MSRSAAPACRVVVTGMGCVTPLGVDLRSTWEAALAGTPGCAAITHFDASELPVRFAAEAGGELDLGEVSPREARRMDRAVRFAMAASHEALADAKLEVDSSLSERVGVAIGSGIGGLGTILHNHAVLLRSGARKVSPFTIPMGIANMPSGCVSIQYGLRGPNLCYVSACASGGHSIGESVRLIARGEADVMLAGGSEAPILDLPIAGFAAMKALSTRNDDPQAASRPFDRGRDGFVVGEGAGVVVLESLERARARGARIRGEIRGYGATADAGHIAAPDAAGEGPIRCMKLAIEDAGVDPSDIGYVNAHATSTPLGDPVEARALRSVFGRHTDALPVSSTKSMTGHMLGAAGAVEAILSLRALETGQLPPTINLDQPDPECELDHVANHARPTTARVALSNSFGFGGTNATLILAVAGTSTD